MEGGLEFEFPEPIIHHIQSLLTGKEAAQTTILSKAWHSAWLTLPHLHFDETDFMAEGDSFYGFSPNSEFLKYVKNKIDWYEQLNLKIDSLNICMRGSDDASLIVKALLKLGATRLSFQLMGRGPVVFPHDVLFGDNNLVELSVHGHRNFEINVQGTKEIKNCRLESLYLYEVHAMPDGLMNTNLDRLRCLVLCYGSFESLFPGDLLSKFPLLTDFTLRMELYMLDSTFAHVEITSRSLECVKLLLQGRVEHGRGVRGVSFKLDVPSIRKFTFESGDDVIPSFSVVSCSTSEWESHVSFTRNGGFTALWFGALNKFLAELRQSKIHLSLLLECQMGFDYKVGDVENVVVRKHELENLTIDTTGMPSYFCYAFFDGLFRFFRPKIVTLDQEKDYGFFYGGQDPGQRKIMFGILCELLDQGIRLKVSDPGVFVFGSLYDLEEANAQVDDDLMGWRPPIPLKSLLDDQGQHQRVRLLLKWKP